MIFLLPCFRPHSTNTLILANKWVNISGISWSFPCREKYHPYNLCVYHPGAASDPKRADVGGAFEECVSREHWAEGQFGFFEHSSGSAGTTQPGAESAGIHSQHSEKTQAGQYWLRVRTTGVTLPSCGGVIFFILSFTCYSRVTQKKEFHLHVLSFMRDSGLESGISGFRSINTLLSFIFFWLRWSQW